MTDLLVDKVAEAIFAVAYGSDWERFWAKESLRTGYVEMAQAAIDAAEVNKLCGMIGWLASELATDDVGKGGDPQTWVELAERHWGRYVEVSGEPV
jgi:hypothetical protein